MIRTLLMVATLSFAPAALAAPCAGFTDVDDTNGFCPHVDWLKNRSITLGCTSTTLFCPGDAVIRLSMAAFMNRLGVAMTPAVLYQSEAGSALDLEAPPPIACATSAFVASDFPRSAQLGAVLTAQVGATAAGIDLTLVQSIDGGTTWTPLNALPASVSGADKRMNVSVWKGDLPLTIGSTYNFGLRIARTAGTGTTGDLTSWVCQLKAVVTSRTGTSAPF